MSPTSPSSDRGGDRPSARRSPIRGSGSTRSRPTTSRRSSPRSPSRGFGANVVSRGEWAVARRAGVPNDRITLEGVGKTDADLRAAVRAAGDRCQPLAVGRARVRATRREVADRDGPARRSGAARAAAARRPGPAQPRRHARDDRRARRRRWGVQVRDDRDRGDRRSSSGWRRTRTARSGRAGSTSTSARSSARSMRGATRCGAASRVVALLRGNLEHVRHARRRRRLPGPAAGRAGARPGAVRPRAARRCSTRVPEDRRPTRLAIEPGRALVARSGWLVARVLHVRDRGGRQVVLDAGMTELIRPALYGARHPIVALTSLGRPSTPATRRRVDADVEPTRVEGPICESTDALGHARPAAAPPRRPRRDQRRRRLRRVARVDLQRPAAAAAGLPRARTAASGSPVARCATRDALSCLRCDASPSCCRSSSSGSCWPASPTRRRPRRPPAGPPFPDPVDGQAVYDYAGIFAPRRSRQAERIVDAIEAQTKAEVVVYTQATGRDDITTDGGRGRRRRADGPVGRRAAGINDGLVILFDLDTSLKHGQVQLYAGSGFADRYLTTDELQAIFDEDMLPPAPGRRPRLGAARRAREGRDGVFDAAPSPGTDPVGGEPAINAPPPGPPFPPPETDRAVYDYAGILSPGRDRQGRGDDRRDRGADRRRGRRLHPGQRRATA